MTRRPAEPASSEVANRAPVRGLSRAGLTVRVFVAAAALVVLALGQLHHTDDYFPLGAVAMFAQARDPDGIVDDTCLEGRSAGDSASHRIPFGAASVGVARSDLEGNLPRLRRDPAGLQQLADAYAERHPDEPPLEWIGVCVDRYRLHDGGPVGPPEHLVLVSWTVR